MFLFVGLDRVVLSSEETVHATPVANHLALQSSACWQRPMAVRSDPESALGVKARLCLFHETGVTAEKALSLADEEITYDYLLQNGSNAVNILTAGLGPMDLKGRGADTAESLRKVGFDAVSLCDKAFANQASLAYGADSVKSAFIVSPQDAVSVAGSEAMHILDIGVESLLQVCAGAPLQAACVLKQLPRGCSLKGVPANTLLDAGLRRQALMTLGYSVSQVVSQCSANSTQLAKLGFTF